LLHPVNALIGGFIQQFQAQGPHTSTQELGQRLSGRLGLSVKQGVAATEIGP
jgi:hypothetical protein